MKKIFLSLFVCAAFIVMPALTFPPAFTLTFPFVEGGVKFSAAAQKPAARQDIRQAARQGVRQAEGRKTLEDIPAFTLHKLGNGEGPTILVIGGIQGDEPGGFSAASLLVTHYKIERGSVWVVPNLNFPSIVYRHRGLHGDMNRKFASLPANDPEYDTVRSIQQLILDDRVDLVINMHDGSGFYRPSHQNALYNPQRWGQCVIIDQDILPGVKLGALNDLAVKVAGRVNRRLLNPEHAYHIKNTETRGKDHEMEKSLSYFAICNNKSAFGVEASKELPAAERVYYHINLLEAFMQELGIKFERDFPLSPNGVVAALNHAVQVNLYDNRLVLPLEDARASLYGELPARKNADLKAKTSNPLLAVIRAPELWRVAYGNRTLTRIKPVFMDFDFSLEAVPVHIDGAPRKVGIGETVYVSKDFQVHTQEGYRVNVIGAQRNRKDGSECAVLITRSDFKPQYSIDKGGNIYRVELYKGQAFAGMFLVNFGQEQAKVETKAPLTATVGGAENEFGR